MYGCFLFFSLNFTVFSQGPGFTLFCFLLIFLFSTLSFPIIFFYLASFKIILYFLSVYLSFTVFFNKFSLNLSSPQSYLSFLLTPSFQASLTFKLYPLTFSYQFILSSCLPALLPSIPSSHLLLLRFSSCLLLFIFCSIFLTLFFTPLFFPLALPICSLFCPSDCLLPNYKSSIFRSIY